jgi:hypothetical protein
MTLPGMVVAFIIMLVVFYARAILSLASLYGRSMPSSSFYSSSSCFSLRTPRPLASDAHHRLT